jgi:hypothetical protein
MLVRALDEVQTRFGGAAAARAPTIKGVQTVAVASAAEQKVSISVLHVEHRH